MKKITRNITFFVLIGVLALFIYIINLTPSDEDITSDAISPLSGDVNKNPVNEEEFIDSFSNVEYPHFSHLPITYQIKTECNEWVEKKIRLAFEKIQKETENIIKFNEIKENPDISIYCEKSPKVDVFAEALPYFSNIQENIIKEAEITMYGIGINCSSEYPEIEVHEILHTLGFAHDYGTSINNVMYPYVEMSSRHDCKLTQMNNKFTKCLKYIYSNGVLGDCSGINFLAPEDSEGECEDDWYPVENTGYCCPEPDMIIDDEGYCDYKIT